MRPIGVPGSPLNPVDWIDHGAGNAGAQQSAIMRGHPAPLSWWQRRSSRGNPTIMQGAPFYIQSRTYDRGAAAFSPKFGILSTNPIGAGVYAPYRLPTIAGPGARYQFGAIFFDVQSIPTTMRMSPTVPAESVSGLLATSHVAAMYATTG